MSSRQSVILLISELIAKALMPRPLTLAESDSDEEEEALLSLIALEQEERLCRPRNKPLRLQGYVENIVPTYSISTFRMHFRMTPAAVQDIENKISIGISRQGQEGQYCVSPRKQILSVAEQYGLSKGTLHACYRRVMYALCSLAKNQIFWPKNPDALEEARQKFQRLAGMPNVIGAIDGCQIEIDAPKDQPAAYRTGKKKYAVQLQAVCTADLVMTDVFVGYPGSVHDVRVLRNSPLHRDAEQLFNNTDYIVGDKAYPTYTWLIPPYKNYGHITEGELKFNTIVSQTRQVIERCFCLLKGRFRRLKHLVIYRTDELPLAILACCVLHNICLRGLYDDPEHIEEYIYNGAAGTSDQNRMNNRDGVEHSSAAGIQKRDNLKLSITGLV